MPTRYWYRDRKRNCVGLGSGGNGMSEMVQNDGGNRIGTGKNGRDPTVHGLIFYPENGGRGFVRKVCRFLQDHTASHPGRPNCAWFPLQEPKISHWNDSFPLLFCNTNLLRLRKPTFVTFKETDRSLQQFGKYIFSLCSCQWILKMTSAASGTLNL